MLGIPSAVMYTMSVWALVVIMGRKLSAPGWAGDPTMYVCGVPILGGAYARRGLQCNPQSKKRGIQSTEPPDATVVRLRVNRRPDTFPTVFYLMIFALHSAYLSRVIDLRRVSAGAACAAQQKEKKDTEL